MAYCAQADVEKAAGGLERLIELTDHAESGNLDADVLNDAIAAADEWIDSYAQKQYAVPFDPAPSIIKRLSAEEAVYRLKDQRDSVTDRDADKHQERIEWLENLARGRVTIGDEPLPSRSSSVTPATGDRSDLAGAVTRDSLGGL